MAHLKRGFLLSLLLLFLSIIPLKAEELMEPSSWRAMPDWLGNPAKEFSLKKLADGSLDFLVNEAGKGMKWLKSLYIDVSANRWLIIEYRCVNYNPQTSDYILWLNDGYPEGIRFPPDGLFKADDEWHTAVIDLYDFCRGPYIYQIALQTQAKSKDAHLYIKRIVFTDIPQKGENGLGKGKEAKVDITPALWQAHTDWLGNPSAIYGVRKEKGTLFYVGEAGKGMKWSLSLPQSLTGYKWVSLRYRAKNINPINDYFLYIANAPGGKAPEEQFPILLSSLDADGDWHTLISKVKVETINTLAIQVQASSLPAEVEIEEISFHTEKPLISLKESLSYEERKRAGKDFMPLNLPPGEGEISEIQRRFSLSDWFTSEVFSTRGITFKLFNRKSFPTLRHKGTLKVNLDALSNCREIYLLLASDLPRWEEPSFGGGEMRRIREADRFKLRLVYKDGDWDCALPFRLASGKYEVVRGIDVYSIAVKKPLKELQLVNGMKNATFFLLALTSSPKPGPASASSTLKAPPSPKTKDSLPALPFKIILKKNSLLCEMREGSIGFDLEKGIRLAEASNKWLFKDMRIQPSPLFILRIADKLISSEDFKIIETKKEEMAEIKGEYIKDDISLQCLLRIGKNKDGEIAISLQMVNLGKEAMKVSTIFPVLRDIDLNASPLDTYYFYPCKGGAINNKDWSFRSYYSGQFPLQIMGVFSYQNGGGIYLRTEDLSATPRWFVLNKKGSKTDIEIEYLQTDLRAGEQLSFPKTIIGFNRGDWRSQLNAYLEWKDYWYKPAVPRKQWFREVFNFRQQFLFYEVPSKSPIFAPETKTFHIEKALKEDEELFGGVDYLHIFDWAATPQFGRVGDYDHWEELGGVENFRKAIEEIQGKGIPVGLYIEGYLVDPQSNLGKAKGKEWQILDEKGKPMPFFAPSYNMCPCLPAWREYLAKTYARVKEQTKAMGYYIDEFGFAMEARNCWNKEHNHPIPCSPVKGEFLTTQAVRSALGDDVVLYTEESPIDVTSQYQDGSFTYAISSISDELSPHHLNLYRFVFPDFKTFEIIVCDQPLGSNVLAVKRVLFNGEGIWLEGTKEWFSDEVREYIRKYHKIMKENAECFTSLHPEPLVPTLIEGVYANKFPGRKNGKENIVWTIYNTNPFSVEGEIMAVDYRRGARFWDVDSSEEIKPVFRGGKAYLRLKIPPQEVIVVKEVEER
ncbi:MAG: DUF6259 domain-containing protein [bacterium]